MLKNSPQFDISTFKRAMSFVRPNCYALVTPSVVVLDAGAKAGPLVRKLGHTSTMLVDQFTPAVLALLQLLDIAGVNGRQLQVVVADDWARPAVLPLLGKTNTDEALETALTKHYRGTYGELMDGWRWCWDCTEKQIVAVAWPESGLSALRSGLGGRDCVLASAKPLGVDIVCAFSGVLSTCWLAILSFQCLTLIRLQNGILQSWSVSIGNVDMTVGLPIQLAREAARCSDTCRAIVIIDLFDNTDIAQVCNALQAAGWVPQAAIEKDLANCLTWRLIQIMGLNKLA